MRPHFTLTVVTSADGFIARRPDEPPQAWASAEEQALFFADVEGADWAVMGRNTHRAADRPDRHRVIFSAAAGHGEWRRRTQLWLDPSGHSPIDLAELVAAVRPMRRALILGGTGVHDWFRAAGAIDQVHLTVEPVIFGAGLTIFSDQTDREPLAALASAGFRPISEKLLNAGGTRRIVLSPERAMGQWRCLADR